MELGSLTLKEIDESELDIENFDERICENNIVIKCENEGDARRWADDFLNNYIIPKYGRDNADKFIPVAGYHPQNEEVWLVFDEKNFEQVKGYLSNVNKFMSSFL